MHGEPSAQQYYCTHKVGEFKLHKRSGNWSKKLTGYGFSTIKLVKPFLKLCIAFGLCDKGAKWIHGAVNWVMVNN
jgi:hypothetical protein